MLSRCSVTMSQVSNRGCQIIGRKRYQPTNRIVAGTSTTTTFQSTTRLSYSNTTKTNNNDDKLTNNKDGALSSFSPDRMSSDRRYNAQQNVPDRLFQPFESEYTIKNDFKTGKPAYLDMQSTTPLDPRVLDSMLPYMIGSYGNPHSRTHQYGWEAENIVEVARGQVADLICADSKEIIFTSGATECNNLAIKGAAHFYSKRGKHIITTQTEHKCVLDSCRSLEQEGYEVTYLPVLPATGRIDLDAFQAAIRPDTVLVSIMAVNNEIGTLQPLEEIGTICRSKKIIFHTDAAQMIGKIPVDVDKLKIDLMSMSSHKVYGPKGVGALYVRRRPRVRLEPMFSGGGQERGLRSGTLSHFLCAGFGSACSIAQQEMNRDHEWVTFLSNMLQTSIEDTIPSVVRNGDPTYNYAGCLNYSFAYVEGESLLMALKNIAVSSGSACTSASLEPSYVLRALGVDDELAHSSIRFGIGRFTTVDEIQFTIDLLQKHVARLREMSPLWEMVQEGIDLKEIQWTQDAAHSHSHHH
jgi:cysteine desulfurase